MPSSTHACVVGMAYIMSSVSPTLVLALRIVGALSVAWLLRCIKRAVLLRIAFTVLLCLAAGLLGRYFLAPVNKDLASVYAIFGGNAMFSGMLTAMATAIGADCIDYAELHTGCRQEATYAALATVPGKFIDIALVSVPTIILGMCGLPVLMAKGSYPAPESAAMAMRLWTGLVPVCSALVALVMVFNFPLTQRKHAEVQQQLEQRRREPLASVHDPPTGHIVPPMVILPEETPREMAGCPDSSTTTCASIAGLCNRKNRGTTVGYSATPVVENLRYFSDLDLLTFANGWQRFGLAKHALSTVAFSLYAALNLIEGSVTFASARDGGGLNADQHRNLASLQMVAGCCFLFPLGYYLLQLAGLCWVMRQSQPQLRRYIAALGELDERVKVTLAKAGALRFVTHHLWKHTCCIFVPILFHYATFQPQL